MTKKSITFITISIITLVLLFSIYYNIKVLKDNNILNLLFQIINTLILCITAFLAYSIGQNQIKAQRENTRNQKAFELYEYIFYLSNYLETYINSLRNYINDKNQDKILKDLDSLEKNENRILLLSSILLMKKDQIIITSTIQTLYICRYIISKANNIENISTQKKYNNLLYNIVDQHSKLSFLEEETGMKFNKIIKIIDSLETLNEKQILEKCQQICNLQ